MKSLPTQNNLYFEEKDSKDVSPLQPLLKGTSKSRDHVTDMQSEVQRGYENYPKITEQLMVTWIQIPTSESLCSDVSSI